VTIEQWYYKLAWLPMDYLRGDQSEVTQRTIITIAKIWHRIFEEWPFVLLIMGLTLKVADYMEEDDD
jgi:hypothetical protein